MTDGRTDRQTRCRSKGAAYYVARVKRIRNVIRHTNVTLGSKGQRYSQGSKCMDVDCGFRVCNTLTPKRQQNTCHYISADIALRVGSAYVVNLFSLFGFIVGDWFRILPNSTCRHKLLINLILQLSREVRRSYKSPLVNWLRYYVSISSCLHGPTNRDVEVLLKYVNKHLTGIFGSL